MAIWNYIKELFSAFGATPIVTKFMVFLGAFFAPVWELYLLLIFLVCLDYIVDLCVWLFNHRKTQKCWEVTKPFIVKLTMYSVLVLALNAMQMYLIKDTIDIFKLVMALPIISEGLGIVATVERLTGVALVDKMKKFLSGWLEAKAPKE